MSRKERKHFTAEQKVAILRRHLLEKIPISNLCDEFGIVPTLFYQWQRLFFERGAAAFEGTRPGRKATDDKDKQIAQLKAKLQVKNEVVAELLEEHVQLKKELGDL
ncbi:MAG: transposase [Planctomycetota bacterium]